MFHDRWTNKTKFAIIVAYEKEVQKAEVEMDEFVECNSSLLQRARECSVFLYRVLKEGSHCYIMTNTLNLREYLNLAEKVGFKLHNLLVWEKNNKVTNRWYMKNGEYVLFLRKGPAKPINDCSCATIHQFDNVRKKEHPTEKPVSLLKMYVTNSSQEGDTVLDPFCGSGSLAEACLLSNRKFVCIDIDEEFYQKTTNRVLTCIKQLPDEMRYKYERSTEKHCENHENNIFWFD